MRARRGAEFSRGLLPPACFSRSGFTDRGSSSKSPNQTWSRAERRNRRVNWQQSIEPLICLTMAPYGAALSRTLWTLSLSLPLSLHLRLILPRFSDPGSYVVAVSKDRAGTAIVARGSGKTIPDGPRLVLEVPLDLKGAEAGSYFLATVRESDNGTYYYPLNVQGPIDFSTIQTVTGSGWREPMTRAPNRAKLRNGHPTPGTEFQCLALG